MISGVRSTALKIVGSSAATPPGTARGLPAAMRVIGRRGRRRPGQRFGRRRRRSSPTSCRAARRGGPPGTASGEARGSSSAARPTRSATPSPVATISRQPIRSGIREVLERHGRPFVEWSMPSGAAKAHSMRIVESPPRPGGNEIEAAVEAELGRDAVDGQAQQRALGLAGRPGGRRGFRIGYLAVAVRDRSSGAPGTPGSRPCR